MGRNTVKMAQSLSPDAINLEKMLGGSNNRVIGITVNAKPRKRSFLANLMRWLKSSMGLSSQTVTHPNTHAYILRIPMYGKDNSADVNILKAVGAHLNLPIPDVITSDSTDGNILGVPYMIQDRLPGQLAVHLWKSLNIEQKKSLVQKITFQGNRLLKTQFCSAS